MTKWCKTFCITIAQHYQQSNRWKIKTKFINKDTHATPLVEKCIKDLQKNFPLIPIVKVDERYSSKMAKDAMIEMGMKKKQRRDKALVDEIAATILLQEYLRQF